VFIWVYEFVYKFTNTYTKFRILEQGAIQSSELFTIVSCTETNLEAVHRQALDITGILFISIFIFRVCTKRNFNMLVLT
jgi:hypothetical protein